jgi:hypothetical protein
MVTAKPAKAQPGPEPEPQPEQPLAGSDSAAVGGDGQPPPAMMPLRPHYLGRLDCAAMQAIVPTDMLTYALQHRPELAGLLDSEREEGLSDAFWIAFQSAFTDAFRQATPQDGLPVPPAAPPQPTAAAKQDKELPAGRDANWPDSRALPTPAEAAGVHTGPKANTVLWVSRDRSAEGDADDPGWPDTWGLAMSDSTEDMVVGLQSEPRGRLNAVDEHGWTCLMWAARLNRAAAVAALLRAGACASLRSAQPVWHFTADQTAMEIAEEAQGWDKLDRTPLIGALRRAELEELAQRRLRAAFEEEAAQALAEGGDARAALTFATKLSMAADGDGEGERQIEAAARLRSRCREAEAERIAAVAKNSRLQKHAAEAEELAAQVQQQMVELRTATAAEVRVLERSQGEEGGGGGGHQCCWLWWLFAVGRCVSMMCVSLREALALAMRLSIDRECGGVRRLSWLWRRWPGLERRPRRWRRGYARRSCWKRLMARQCARR